MNDVVYKRFNILETIYSDEKFNGHGIHDQHTSKISSNSEAFEV